MKIASCFLVLLFAIHLEFSYSASSSEDTKPLVPKQLVPQPSVPKPLVPQSVAPSLLVPHQWRPRRDPKWEVIKIRDYYVKVLRNPDTGILEKIGLVDIHNPTPKFDPNAYMGYVVDVEEGLEFVVHLDRQGKWFALSLMNENYRNIFGYPDMENIKISQIRFINMPIRHSRATLVL